MLTDALQTRAATPWEDTRAELAAARAELRLAPAGIARQRVFDRVLAAGRRCTEVVHEWLADSFGLEPVQRPRTLLSLDVDGILEDWRGDFSATDITGAASLRLLQLGDVGIVLNTAHSSLAVRQRAQQFSLLGGVSAFGAVTLDYVFGNETRLNSDRGEEQLGMLRTALRADPAMVIDSAHDASIRASRIADGQPRPIKGGDARQLIDRLGAFGLTFWVAPDYTDFVDRKVDKGRGLEHLRQGLGLSSLPLSAIGDGACDVPMLKMARLAFVPAATLPTYFPPRRQRLVRSRFLGSETLWEAACHLVPSADLQRYVLEAANSLTIPEWFPQSLRQLPPERRPYLPRLIETTLSRSKALRRQD